MLKLYYASVFSFYTYSNIHFCLATDKIASSNVYNPYLLFQLICRNMGFEVHCNMLDVKKRNIGSNVSDKCITKMLCPTMKNTFIKIAIHTQLRESNDKVSKSVHRIRCNVLYGNLTMYGNWITSLELNTPEFPIKYYERIWYNFKVRFNVSYFTN